MHIIGFCSFVDEENRKKVS